MRWIVDIGYPLDERGNGIYDEEIRAIAEEFGTWDSSAGAGFGMRDMQFETNRKNVAISLRDRLATYIRVDENSTKYELGKPYANYNWEPGNLLLYLLYNKDYKEFWRVLFKETLNPMSQYQSRKANKKWLAKVAK